MAWWQLGLVIVAVPVAAVALLWVAAQLFGLWLQRMMPQTKREAALVLGEILVRNRPTPVLAIAAHPDDLEYYAGGTLLRLTSQGTCVIAVLATRGERGGRQANLAAIREREQAMAARLLGYHEVRYLGWPDRQVVDGPRLRSQVLALFDQIQPQLVLSFDAAKPLPPYIHPDHQAIGAAVVAAWQSRRRQATLLLFHSRRPNVLVAIDDVAMRKQEAFQAHASQVHPDRRNAAQWAMLVLQWLRPRWLKTGGTGPGRSESFYRPTEEQELSRV